MSLSVVIPTLNEEAALPLLLADLRALDGKVDEVVVVDAGSSDGTIATAEVAGARVVPARRGRARQLNAGARATQGTWLLFLHADSRLGPEAREALRQAVAAESGIQAAVFRFAIDLPWFWKRFLEVGQRVREVLFGLPYGDQGLLVRREHFEAVGRYPEVPLMEDVEIIRRLRRCCVVTRLPAPLLTSGRRYCQRGVMRTWLHHFFLLTLYGAGIAPARLARWRDGATALPR